MKTHRNSLKRRTPLRRGRKPIPRRGKRGKRLYEDAEAVYARVVEEEKVCRVCGLGEGLYLRLEIHHILPRSSGREQLERSNLMRVCHVDHKWLTSPSAIQREWAYEEGWLRSRFS